MGSFRCRGSVAQGGGAVGGLGVDAPAAFLEGFVEAGELEGGLAGRSGRITINPDTPEEAVHIGLLSNLALKPGDVVRVDTGSAGGVGPPRERDPERVARDLRNGIVTPQTARDVYGLSDDAIAEAMKV